jgi:hypothetical protein
MKAFLVITILFLLAFILSRPSATAQNPSFPVGQGFYPAGAIWIPIQVDANGVVQTD